MPMFKSVTEDEFKAFLETYPGPLHRDVLFISDPLTIRYMDPLRAPYWPDSLVAQYRSDEYAGYDFLVIKDIDAPVDDDGEG